MDNKRPLDQILREMHEKAATGDITGAIGLKPAPFHAFKVSGRREWSVDSPILERTGDFEPFYCNRTAAENLAELLERIYTQGICDAMLAMAAIIEEAGQAKEQAKVQA